MNILDPFFHIVLVEPEIPNNTGNIGRTCVGASCELHLVGKLGFELTDKYLKRAGLDYWKHLTWHHHQSWDEWQKQIQDQSRVFYFSTKAEKTLYQAKFKKGDWLVFGKETKGLGTEILKENDAHTLLIPQFGKIRSLNLANAVAIAAYEGIRQIT